MPEPCLFSDRCHSARGLQACEKARKTRAWRPPRGRAGAGPAPPRVPAGRREQAEAAAFATFVLSGPR